LTVKRGVIVLAMLFGSALAWTAYRRASNPDVAPSATSTPAAQGAPDSTRELVTKSVWDGVYTEKQAARGDAVYRAQCQLCHLKDLRGGGFASSLVDRAFTDRWNGQNLGDLYAVMRSTMPQGAPASLSRQEYVDVAAFLLKANGYPVGEEELIPDRPTLELVIIAEG
jgi:mono/diheme cytochrome c family protein